MAYLDPVRDAARQAPVTITATMAVWLGSHYTPHHLMACMERGNSLAAANMLTFWGGADEESFGDYVRMGEADVTIRLIPRDEQIRMAVAALQRKLDETRAEYHKTQQEILAQISKLQAITYDAEASCAPSGVAE